ncbi:Zinc-binding dehydrogenase [Ceratobasidium sp. AG-Ba]|nr:Zinc-binding dehydrogenase [Ceratobasidium sp. AG-Ba]
MSSCSCSPPALTLFQSLDFKILRYGIIAQDWPVTGGNEFAGTVVALGLGVEKVQVGDRIIASSVGWIEGNEFCGWQEFALVHADLCTKIPDSVPFPLAATAPTSFITASIALALDLGLRYPDPPPLPPRKTAAGVWAAALASLKGGAEFEFDLEDGVVEGGSWYPSESAMRKYSNCLGINAPAPPSHLPMVPSSTGTMSESDRKQILDAERYKVNNRTFRLSADDNGLAPIPASPYAQDQDAYAPLHSAGPHRPPQPAVLPVPRYSATTRVLQPIDLGDPWDNVHPMSWGTGDLSREAMDRRLGSGWNEPDRASRLVEVVDIGSGSSSGSSGMGRNGSDESYTSVEEPQPASHPGLPSMGASDKGRENGRRRGSASGPGALTGVGAGGLVLRGTAVNRAHGSTSPFRVPPAVSSRRHGSPPYVYRVREASPGPRPSTAGSASGRPTSSGAGASFRPTTGGAFPRPPSRPMSALEELIYHGHASKPALPVAYPLDEPILIWGGGTCVGRNALQLLKRAGYTDVLVVASTKRHTELSKLSPPGTRFFDYRDARVVSQIQVALGDRDLKKVLECVSLPHTLKLVAQVVSPGAIVAALLPVQTPMPDGVELKMTKFGKCHDFDGKDVASAVFGREKMWPLLGEMLRAGEYVFPEMVHLRGGMQACATNAMAMMARGENAGKRLVFSVPDS